MLRKFIVEFLGTFWLVLCGCGAAIMSGNFGGSVAAGILGVSFAFGLSIVTFAYAFGGVSGAHMNPAVSFAMYCAGRLNVKTLLNYVVAQVIGGIAASGLLYLIIFRYDFSIFKASNFAVNGFGSMSPGGYQLPAVFITEAVMTFMFTLFILAVTARKNLSAFAPLAIGLCLTLIHIVTIPVSNTSVNPARSTGPALFNNAVALQQLWVFWVAPLVGALFSGLLFKKYFKKDLD